MQPGRAALNLTAEMDVFSGMPKTADAPPWARNTNKFLRLSEEEKNKGLL